MRKETGKEAIFLKLDLGDLNSVKASAEEFLRYALMFWYPETVTDLARLYSKEENLHILFNNA